MVALTLTEVPTPQQLVTAVHQEDGIIVQAKRGERYAFAPSRESQNGGIKGTYCQVGKEGFLNIRGEAVLYVDHEGNTALLELLTH